MKKTMKKTIKNLNSFISEICITTSQKFSFPSDKELAKEYMKHYNETIKENKKEK